MYIETKQYNLEMHAETKYNKLETSNVTVTSLCTHSYSLILV